MNKKRTSDLEYLPHLSNQMYVVDEFTEKAEKEIIV